MTGSGRVILHLSADYPDPLVAQKTRAVSNLLELVPEHAHWVYSLNRVSWGTGIHAIDFADKAGEAHRAVAYGAPPRGFLLKRSLERLADWLASDIEGRGIRPDLIHAHKLSVEGLVGERLARRLGCPLAVSVQGDSDLKIIGARRDLRPRWRKIWQDARVIFPFAPWTRDRMTALLGPRSAPTRLLPCPGPADAILQPRIVGPVLRTAFHLGVSARKNADGLIRATGLAARQVPEIKLEVIGGGDPSSFARLSALADQEAPGRVRFLGSVPHEEVQGLLNGACAFVLPSHRESFGMVFSEALLAGCPCLIPRGWGIDGYLEDGSAVLAVPSGDVAAISEALIRLVREEKAFKSRLSEIAESGGLELFRRRKIAEVYRAALENAISA